MAIFRPRNRIEVLRDMAARVVARSRLKGLERNSATFHVLAAIATEITEVYVQLARLRLLFSIDRATGSDLDERAREIVGNMTARRSALNASGQVRFSRVSIVGTTTIPSGTIVAAQDASGLVKYRTTAVGSITVGNTLSAAVPCVALEAGIRGNVEAATIVRFVSRVAGVVGVTNSAKLSNGRDRENDASFRARIRDYVQALSRGTVRALEGFARNVILSDGRRVLFAHVYEPAIPGGQIDLYIDDGVGSAESYDSTYIGAPDLCLTAAGGETRFNTTAKPIRDDGSFVLEINGVVRVRNVDYTLNPALGQIDLSELSYPSGLGAGFVCEAAYRYYTGLIQQTQRVIDGDAASPLSFPGVRAGGVMVLVKAPQVIFQSVTASIAVATDYDTTLTAAAAASAIQDYINGLDIGEHVISAEIVQRAMEIAGVTNFRITDLTGSTPPVADQVILPRQVARIIGASIVIT